MGEGNAEVAFKFRKDRIYRLRFYYHDKFASLPLYGPDRLHINYSVGVLDFTKQGNVSHKPKSKLITEGQPVPSGELLLPESGLAAYWSSSVKLWTSPLDCVLRVRCDGAWLLVIEYRDAP